MESFNFKIEKNLKIFYRDLELCMVKCGRGEDNIKVLFATKYLNSEQLASFIDLYYQLRGQKVFIGENKVQDAQQKFNYLEQVRPDLNGKYYRVMIGNLQKNKINKALPLFDEIWGVDSLDLAQTINSRAKLKKVPIFLEVNISEEATKRGIKKEKAEEVIAEIKSRSMRDPAEAGNLSNLTLKGLMTMAPATDNRQMIRSVFRELKQIASKHNLLTSMGMSNDWQEAVESGSDILRIGAMIFR